MRHILLLMNFLQNNVLCYASNQTGLPSVNPLTSNRQSLKCCKVRPIKLPSVKTASDWTQFATFQALTA